MPITFHQFILSINTHLYQVALQDNGIGDYDGHNTSCPPFSIHYKRTASNFLFISIWVCLTISILNPRDPCEPKTVQTYLVSPQEFLGFFFNYKCV